MTAFVCNTINANTSSLHNVAHDLQRNKDHKYVQHLFRDPLSSACYFICIMQSYLLFNIDSISAGSNFWLVFFFPLPCPIQFDVDFWSRPLSLSLSLDVNFTRRQTNSTHITTTVPNIIKSERYQPGSSFGHLSNSIQRLCLLLLLNLSNTINISCLIFYIL